MTLIERFLKYVNIPSASNAGSDTIPSTPEQLALAKVLADDLLAIGVKDARVDEFGYVYGSIPANCEGQPSIGLIAHLDVVDDVPCAPMNARVVKNYDGGAIELGHGYTLDPAEFGRLKALVGKDLIVTDGSTILGADDKAGVAEIIELAHRLLTHPEIRHGDVKIAFTPDEEIGGGAEKLDIKAFGADFAYTVDGGAMGGIEYENFNAASGEVVVHGLSVHPGSAKNKLRNAAVVKARAKEGKELSHCLNGCRFCKSCERDTVSGWPRVYCHWHLRDMDARVICSYYREELSDTVPEQGETA